VTERDKEIALNYAFKFYEEVVNVKKVSLEDIIEMAEIIKEWLSPDSEGGKS
jgi:hypothetical protein